MGICKANLGFYDFMIARCTNRKKGGWERQKHTLRIAYTEEAY
jgi:hypothetical protein